MDVGAWSSPVGLATFVVGMALTLFILSMTIKTLSSIAPPDRRRR